MAICPHCEKPIAALRLQPLAGTAPNGTSWNCIAFVCPSCDKAISADIDVTAVRSDIVDRLDRLLGSR